MSSTIYTIVLGAMLGIAVGVGICTYLDKRARRQMKRKPPTWRNGRIEK